MVRQHRHHGLRAGGEQEMSTELRATCSVRNLRQEGITRVSADGETHKFAGSLLAGGEQEMSTELRAMGSGHHIKRVRTLMAQGATWR